MKSKILVVGSINMDLVVNTDEIPKVGETIIGNDLLQIPGGKGANQAVSIAKLGNQVIFLGKVGNDIYGESLLTSMKKAGVNIDFIEKTKGASGIAVINVDKNGNNNIVVIPGANNEVDIQYIDKHYSAFEAAEIVVFQLEIPIGTVKEGLRISKILGKTTILNPAPAMDLDDEIIRNIDILIPNEHELQRISKVKIIDQESLLIASKVLINKGIKKIIVTLGSKGVLYMDSNKYEYFKAYKVNVVDTTAAGDSFIGGFISSYLINSDNIENAIQQGQTVAALTIQKIGAQCSLPTLEEVVNFKSESK